jgi:hypothetical protein
MLIALAKNVDPRVPALLSRHEGVTIALDSPQSALITEDEAIAVDVELVDVTDAIWMVERPRQEGKPKLAIINGLLDEAAAARLEDAGISYFDAGGRSWLRSRRRTKRSARSAKPAKRTLYAASIKLAQLLADHPGESWTERGLAACGHTTQATAHRLLSRLEAEGLMSREGQGRASLRWVRDPRRLRRWLATEARPNRVTLLPCFVSNPFELPTVVGRNFALTGAAAAERLGLRVMSELPHALVRVGVAEDELDEIPQALGGFRTESGANLVLIADPDRLAFVDPRRPEIQGETLAPPSRIMLDLFLEPRGEAVVDVFLDLWGDKEVT